METKTIVECIRLLKIDGQNTKQQVLEILRKELANRFVNEIVAKLEDKNLVNEEEVEKDVFQEEDNEA